MTTLNNIPIGGMCSVLSVSGSADMKRRLYDIGLVKGTSVMCLGKSPLGDPHSYLIRGCVIALRSDDCKNIIVGKCV